MKKLLILHGLNNKVEALHELGKSFAGEFDVIYMKLPHHSEGPLSFNIKTTLKNFRNELSDVLIDDPYIISYSLGCTYLQYFFEKGLIDFTLEKVIYLSPALKTKFNLARLRFLPTYFPLPSFSPKEFRLRSFCYWGQYRMLFELTKKLELNHYPKTFADPEDELIRLEGIKYRPLNREYLSYGEHHLSFHPRYFKNNEWEELIREIKVRFQEET